MELERAHGAHTRFVLLGSVASDKYVRPLTRVFGDHLLFPTDFVGRGDMSRGALLLTSGARRERIAVRSSGGRGGERPPRRRGRGSPFLSAGRARGLRQR